VSPAGTTTGSFLFGVSVSSSEVIKSQEILPQKEEAKERMNCIMWII